LSEEEPRHKGDTPGRHRVRNRVLIGLSVLVIVVTSGLVIAYKKLEGNINAVSITKQLGTDRPTEAKVEGPKRPLNILIMGSDSRAGTKIGGDTPGLSDTTILLHLSADRTRAYGVSIPRDAMVQRPECSTKNGKGTVPAALTQFNAAYAVGGPACTIKTVEKLTDIRIEHYVVVNFNGFTQMVNALGGVTVCVPTEVNDTVGHIKLPAGTYKVNGRQALDYVRVRHDLGASTGDIGRMKRQQTFISAMIAKVVDKGTLANPVRLYNFLDAATRSLTTDPEFAHLKTLATLGNELKDIGLDKIQFITVPNGPYPPDPNRLEITSEAGNLWRRIRLDKPLGKYADTAVSPSTTAGGKPGKPSPSPSPTGGTSPSQSPSPQDQQSEEARKQAAAEAGLCT
jgi:LCP family protein required for cell wall assembly